jgi:hypothetical protein
MKTFQCDNCGTAVFFENIRCLGCGSTLGIVPSSFEMLSVKDGTNGIVTGSDGQPYRFCKNSLDYGSCNHLVKAADASLICRTCHFTEIAPDLTIEANRELWAVMEQAKRRLLFSLFQLGIPPLSKFEDPVKGLSFCFLAEGQGHEKVITGHMDGVITISLAEADKANLEARRQQLGERYRTLLGHFRHEIGHYYWDRLIADGGKIDEFRAEFGDESVNYADALQAHYTKPADDFWKNDFISAYAASHPWEDWAETFAHFLHMQDVVETSRSVGLIAEEGIGIIPDFATNISLWLNTSFRMNQLGRSIGSGDLYPFVLNDRVIKKMEFIHNVVFAAAAARKAS